MFFYEGLDELERKKSCSRGTEGGQLFYVFFVSHREGFQPETPVKR